MKIGKNVQFDAESSIGRYSSLGDDCIVKRASIGSFCSIANRVVINPWNHPTDWLSIHEFQYRDDSYDTDEYRRLRKFPRPNMHRVSIGNDVWIGISAVVLPGVRIADGAIVGAGAVVADNVDPYTIVAGVPARIVRCRFDNKTIDRLLILKWWNAPFEALNGVQFDRIQDAISLLEERKRQNPWDR